MAFPLPLLPWVEARFGLTSASGYEPNALGYVYTYLAGTSTPKATYTTNAVGATHTNPIRLDADGRPVGGPVYLNGAYTLDVRDADDNSLYTIDYVADIGSLFASTLGSVLVAGSKGVSSSPYVVLSTDFTVTIDTTTDPFIVTLPDVTTWTQPLIIVNESDSIGGGNARLTAQGGQTVQNDLQGTGYFVVPVAGLSASMAILLPDAANSNWIVVAYSEGA